MNNNKIMLVYGFDEEKETLEHIVKKENLPNYKVIEESMGRMKIKDIIDSLKLEVYDCRLPKEKVILFNNFDDEELDNTINIITSSIKPMPILAVITENSIEWTFEYLLEHLIEEREWFKKHKG